MAKKKPNERKAVGIIAYAIADQRGRPTVAQDTDRTFIYTKRESALKQLTDEEKGKFKVVPVKVYFEKND